MRAIPLLLASAVLGAGAIGAVVKMSPASAGWASHPDWERRHAGPDSGRVAILIDALGKTDPIVCELIADQIGNFWWGGERAGVGRLAGATATLQAAKDSDRRHDHRSASDRAVGRRAQCAECVRSPRVEQDARAQRDHCSAIDVAAG